MKGVIINLFLSIQELKEKVFDIWDRWATDVHTIRSALKKFLPHLLAVCERYVGSIKALFG